MLLAATPWGLSALLALGMTATNAQVTGDKERIIVVFHETVGDVTAVANEHQRRYGGEVNLIYRHALNGYAAEMPRGARIAIARDPRVAYVELDQTATTLGEIPTGVDRTEADRHPAPPSNGSSYTPDVDIAVIDTGVSFHPDLSVAGGANCTRPGLLGSCINGDFADGNGHGTHVAGTAAAIANGAGVVGVAPGARVWAVKVLANSGTGQISWIVAGIDWVTARASTIEVANMSLGCGCFSQAWTDAVTRSTSAGVVHVVAAGNEAQDAGGLSPANHPNAIAVSAMADFDGKPGGGSPATCRSDVDDTFANFSNFGSVVDLAAPGVCITSTWNNGGYVTISGTSMASPHSAGAAALYILEKGVDRSSNRWSTVLNGLRSEWSISQNNPCGFSEGKSSEPMLLLAPCTL